MGNAIFISYRRDDSEGESGRLFDDLVRAFGNDSVFMDVAGIKPGADFRKAIEDNVSNCGVCLAIVGPAWATITNAAGQRRLDDPNDFVALEIGSALRRGVPVIPVLVHDARMPAPDTLPETLQDFSYRNSVELSHARWNSDVQLLIDALKPYVAADAGSTQRPVHATIPAQLPAPNPSPSPARSQSRLPILMGVAVVAILAMAGVFYFLSHSGPPAVSPVTTTTVPAPASGPTSSGASLDGSSLDGVWNDPNPRTAGNSLVTLTVSGAGSTLAMHAIANCASGPCDWGTQAATFDGTNATSTFTPSAANTSETRQAQIVVHTVSGGLDVLVNNTFTGSSGSRTSQFHRVFVPGS